VVAEGVVDVAIFRFGWLYGGDFAKRILKAG